MTKTEATIEHLRKYGSITTWEAIEKHKNTRLSDTIFRLRHKGENIISDPVQTVDSYGNKCSYVVYRLVKTA